MVVQVHVCLLDSTSRLIDVCDTDAMLSRITVQQLTERIVQLTHQDGDIRLVYGTEYLEENQVLSHYGIKHMSTLHVVMKMPGGV